MIGSDDVAELSDAADFDAVGMALQRHQHRADEQSIFEIVNIFQLMRRDFPHGDFFVGFHRVIPDVPFVEAQVERLLGASAGFGVVARGDDRLDEHVHVDGAGQERAEVVRLVAVIGVERNVFDEVVAVAQDRVFPRRKGRHGCDRNCRRLRTDRLDLPIA